MDRDRERERFAGRSDVASLWIDFLLLPPKLEEHLAAGPDAIPSPCDLISMFLEQALLNHKSVNGSSGNIANKDVETQGSTKAASKTASVLCERAARVAVVAQLTLWDIELSVPSQQHQFVLLKTLIRHDETRSLLHQCNLHRWLIHKALQCHPVGSAAPNAVFPATRLGSWTAGDELGEVFHNIVNSNGELSSLCGSIGDSRMEEERASVEFLEQVLQDEEFVVQVLQQEEVVAMNEDSTKLRTDSSVHKAIGNGGLTKGQDLSPSYKCQVMFDVAEVHFMRGRIRQAYEYFERCRETISFLRSQDITPGKEPDGNIPLTSSTSTGRNAFPVPEDRLAGFIVACRMLLLGSSADDSKLRSNVAAKEELFTTFGAPSPGQRAVIACEQSRWIARKYRSLDSSHNASANGGADCKENLAKRENCEISREDDVDFAGRMNEVPVPHRQNKRSRSSSYCGDLNGDSRSNDIEGENGQSRRKETDLQDKGLHSLKAEPDVMEVGECSGAGVKETCTNGSETDSWGKNAVELDGAKRELKDFYSKDGTLANDSKNGQTKQLVGLAETRMISDSNHSTDMGLIVDMESDSAEEALYELGNVVKGTLKERQQKLLTETFVEDILRGHLSWAYCLSVENDPMLSKLDRSKLAACNLVRAVLEGASVEIFLRISDQFEGSEDAVVFLMRLLLAIMVMEEGHRSANESSSVNLRQDARLRKLGILKSKLPLQGTVETVSVVAQRVRDLAMYVCCVIDEPWCWYCAAKHRLAENPDLPRFTVPLPTNYVKTVDCLPTLGTADSLRSFTEPNAKKLEEKKPVSDSDILLSLLELESTHEVEAFLEKLQILEGRAVAMEASELEESSRNPSVAKRTGPVASFVERLFSFQSKSVPKLSGHQVQDIASLSSSLSNDQARGGAVGTNTRITNLQDPAFEADVVTVLKRQAFTALEISKNTHEARRFFELALGFQPNELDCMMMLWLLERTSGVEGRTEGRNMVQWTRSLPARVDKSTLPNSVLFDFTVLLLIEKESWPFLSEVCKWVLSLLKESTARDSEVIVKSESDSVAGGPGVSAFCSDSSAKLTTVPGQTMHPRLLQTLKLATILGDLLPLCISLQAAGSRIPFNEDVARLGSTLSQLFEDFMCLLIGIETGRQGQGSDGTSDWRGIHSGMSQYTGASGVPLISKITNPRALMALASLTAGWLHRWHTAGLTTWSLAVERYGVLAGVTAGAVHHLPAGSLPYASTVLRPVDPRVLFGRELFGVLLECIVSIPGVVEGDREKGHRWFQGLADLAFEDDAHVKALRLYLQAGAIRSAHYCDRTSSMGRDIFTLWVIQRMVAACRAIGAGVQAAVLCQCTMPAPDHELAFRILQENTLIVDRDASAYFECIWEVPILELLVNMHAKAGDEGRVASLIGLLQQPALNVHNPPAIREAHICTMKQRFLQRLAGELLY